MSLIFYLQVFYPPQKLTVWYKIIDNKLSTMWAIQGVTIADCLGYSSVIYPVLYDCGVIIRLYTGENGSFYSNTYGPCESCNRQTCMVLCLYRGSQKLELFTVYTVLCMFPSLNFCCNHLPLIIKLVIIIPIDLILGLVVVCGYYVFHHSVKSMMM